MLLTCLVPRLRGHFDPHIVTSTPNPILKSAESVLFPLLLSSGGQHQYLLFCASERNLLISYISSLPQPPFQSQLWPAALEVKTGSRSPGFGNLWTTALWGTHALVCSPYINSAWDYNLRPCWQSPLSLTWPRILAFLCPAYANASQAFESV